MRIRIGSVAFAILIATCTAAADGCFMPPEDQYGRLYGDLGAASTEQKGIIIEAENGSREVLLLQTTYQGPASEFAWVVPVPGEPGEDDVFVASSSFIDGVLDTTAPIVRTHIDVPEAPSKHMGDEAAMPPPSDMGPGSAPMGAEPSVTLHRRMEVGDYDVSVLSATGPNVLVDWLNEHGYQTPEDHADIFGHYVDKDWYFVAMRVLPGVKEEKPVLDDVKPIGIEFACEELVYPLYISRASSRQNTAMTLISLTREPVECEQMQRARLPLSEHGRGTSYARIRRETIEQHPQQPSAVLEYAGYGGIDRADLHWREDRWARPGREALRSMWATRLWTIIDREEMVDLTFAPADVEGDRVVVERTGALPGPGLLAVRLPVWPVAGVLFFVLALGRIEGRRLPEPMLLVSLVAGGAAICATALPRGLQGLAVGLCVVCAAIVATLFIAGKSQRTEERMGPRELIAWTLLAAGWVAAAGHITGDWASHMYGLPAWSKLAMVAWLALLLVEIVRGWRRATRPAQIRIAVAMAVSLIAFMLLVPSFIGNFANWLEISEGGAILAGLLAAALLAGVGWGVLRVMRRERGIATWEHVALAAAAVAAALLAIHAWGEFPLSVRFDWQLNYVTSTLPLFVGSAVLFGYALASVSLDGAAGRAARVFALTLLVLGSGVSVRHIALTSPAYAGAFVGRHSGLTELDRALTALDNALMSFIEDAGGYPASLGDLTEMLPPERGLDSSGNPVDLPGDRAGSQIRELPTDPLTERNDTWVYEVTGSPMIDSGGLEIELKRESTIDRPRVSTGVAPDGPASPFEEGEAAEGRFGGPAVPMARLVKDGGVFAADMDAGQSGVIYFTGGNVRPVAACLSPDGTQIAWAYPAGDAVGISVADLPGAGHAHRRLLPGPWKVADVDSIAWHPTKDLWALTTQETVDDGDGPSSEDVISLLEPGSMPREIARLHSEDRRPARVHWAPDGRTLYLLQPDDAGQGMARFGGRVTRTGLLLQLSLTGEKLDGDGVAADCDISNRHGAAFVHRDAQRIFFVDTDGTEHILDPPEGVGPVIDLLPTADGLLAAYGSPTMRVHSRGMICLFERPGEAPVKLATFPMPRNTDSYWPILLGRRDNTVAFSFGVSVPYERVVKGGGVYVVRRDSGGPECMSVEGVRERYYPDLPPLENLWKDSAGPRGDLPRIGEMPPR